MKDTIQEYDIDDTLNISGFHPQLIDESSTNNICLQRIKPSLNSQTSILFGTNKRSLSLDSPKKTAVQKSNQKAHDDSILSHLTKKKSDFEIANNENEKFSTFSFSTKTKKRPINITQNYLMNYKLENNFEFIRTETQIPTQEKRFKIDSLNFNLNQKILQNEKNRTIKTLNIFSQQKSMNEAGFGQSFKNADIAERMHLSENGINIDRIYQNFLIVGPLKSDLRRFLNNMDLTMNIQSIQNQNCTDLDRSHFELLRKYLNPIPKKINIEKIPNNVSKISEFLFRYQDHQKAFECFNLPLVSDMMKCTKGFNFKEIIKQNRENCSILNETNPMGFIYYHVAQFEDFFIDSKTTTKFNDKIIEIYKFPRFFIFQSIYPFSDIFTKVLEFIVSQYKQAKLNKFVQLVDESKTTIADFESIDANSFSIFDLPSIQHIFSELNRQFINSNFGAQISITMNDKMTKFALPERKDCMYADNSSDFYKVFKYFSYEEVLFLVSCLASERTLVFISEKQKKISRTISSIVGLFRPFNWVFPLIYSLPRDSFEMISSPVPIIVGVQNTALGFIADMNTRLSTSSLKNCTSDNSIYIYLDHDIIKCEQSLVETNYLPSNFDFLKKFEKYYKDNFNSKVSKFIKIETSKSKNMCKFVGRSALSKPINWHLEKRNNSNEDFQTNENQVLSYEIFSIFGRLWQEVFETIKTSPNTKDQFIQTVAGSLSYSFYAQEKNCNSLN